MIPLCVSLPLNFKFKILTSLVSVFFAFDCKEKEKRVMKSQARDDKRSKPELKMDKFEEEVMWKIQGDSSGFLNDWELVWSSTTKFSSCFEQADD